MINKELLKERGVEHNRKEIERFSKKIRKMFKLIKKNTPECYKLNAVADLESIEYILQILWGFPLDRNKHKWWYRIPGCICPQMDNSDRWGTAFRIYNDNCPWHGDGSKYREEE